MSTNMKIFMCRERERGKGRGRGRQRQRERKRQRQTGTVALFVCAGICAIAFNDVMTSFG